MLREYIFLHPVLENKQGIIFPPLIVNPDNNNFLVINFKIDLQFRKINVFLLYVFYNIQIKTWLLPANVFDFLWLEKENCGLRRKQYLFHFEE